MKFSDILLVRKKYANYIFELCYKKFDTPKVFLDEELQFKKNMDYDWMLQTQATRIINQNNLLNQRIREFAKLSQFDKKIMNDLMGLKITFKNQKKAIEELQAKHHKEISQQYNETIEALCTKILAEIQSDALLAKMQLAIKKTEKPFVNYCKQWKYDKKAYHEDIASQSSLITKICDNLLSDIDETIEMENNNQQYSNNKIKSQLATSKRTMVAASCTNLAHYVENFKKFYPETLTFKNNSLTKLDLKNEFSNLWKIPALGSKQKQTDSTELTSAIAPIKRTQKIFYGLYDINRTYLIKLDTERKKMAKISLPEEEFTKATITQWLEYDPNSIFYLFSEYLKEHSHN